ncbi:uncharacterized protein LOC141599876 [Silene latifolia]|uniref:uncharacterized protein LOC141599876 n=1 Tax=Silene latifolia TaxID=37657 RepID=UPI003D77F475
MEAHQQEEEEEQVINQKHKLLIRIGSKRRTWVAVFILVYGIIFYFSWNLLQTILTWHKTSVSSATSPAMVVYAAVMLGLVFGVMSMAAAFAVAMPAMVVTWITILVLLAFFGKSRRDLVVEGKKLTAEISGILIKILIKEGNFVAALCAVLGYFMLLRNRPDEGVR